MKRKTFFVITGCLTILGLLLASCAPAVVPTSTATSPPPTAKQAVSPESKVIAPTPSPKAPTETPRYGGIFTSYLTGSPPSLDAQQEGTLLTAQIVAPFYSNLVQAEPMTVDKVVPGLAEKWEMSQDGLTWTFDVRQGVKFHDGTLFTVEDAVFNLQRLIDPPKGVVSNMTFLLKPVVKSLDREGNKVRISLSSPLAVMLDTFALNYSTPMYPKSHIEKYGDMKTTAMGTGPFKLKSYTPGVSLEGVKNADFWIKGRPYLDGYRFLIIKDESTRLSAFRTGKVNMTGKQLAGLKPSDMELLKKEDPQTKFYPSPSILGPWFFMNSRNPLFQNQKVRKAISLALDRQAALRVLGQGYGLVGKPFGFDPWGIPTAELPKLPGYRAPKDQDMADAKKLMADAGYPSGFELTILARHMSQSRDAAVFMTNQLAQLGIRAKVQVLEDPVFWDSGRKAAHEAMVYTPAWISSDPIWLGRFFIPGGALNFAGNDDDKELVKMWDEQIRIVEPEKRYSLLRKIEEHLLEALPGVSIMWNHVFIGVRSEVRNFNPGMSDYMGNTLEEIWLTK